MSIAAAVENCVFVVVYSRDAAGAPPALNADIDLSQPGPGLILSDVKIEGSARAEAGLFMLGDASVVWGNVTLSGSSASGNPLPPLTETANAGDVLAAAEGAKTRRTYTADEDVGMLSAYDLVINPGVTLTVRAPESEGTHCVTVERSLTVKTGGRLTAEDGQRLELRDGATVTGLTLYEQDGEGSYREFTLNGAAEFVFDADAVYDPDGSNITGLWVRSEGGGGGEPCAITVTAGAHGDISPAGEVTVGPGEEFTITPEPGYAVESVTVSVPPYGDADTEDIMRDLSYNGDGAFTFTLRDVSEGMGLHVTFAQESEESIDELLGKSYCILEDEVGSEAEVETALAREFGYLGYAIGADRIFCDIDTAKIATDIAANGYGTFEFTVDGMPLEKATGYIVKDFSDVIFKYDGTRGGEPVNEIRVAKAADGALGEFPQLVHVRPDSGRRPLTGEAGSDVLAVAVLLYSGDRLLRLETAGVTGGTFTAAIAITLSSGVYTVKAADYEGGEYAAATFTHTAPPVDRGGLGGGFPTPTYSADVAGGSGLPVNVNTAANSASVNLETVAGKLSDGGNTVVTLPSIPGVTTYTAALPASSLSGSGTGSLTLDTGAGTVTIPGNMLSGTGLTGDAGITIGEGDRSGLSEDVRAAIGNRPIIQITLSVDGRQIDWNNPSAPVAASIPYTPTAAELENPESIVIWYMDGSGRAVSVPNGRYDPGTGTVTFSTTHFSCYAVGSSCPSSAESAKDRSLKSRQPSHHRERMPAILAARTGYLSVHYLPL